MFLEDSTAVVDSLRPTSERSGLRILDSSYVGDDLTTIAQDLGVSMEGDSSLHLSSWTAQLHDTPLMMSSENTAIIRSFSPTQHRSIVSRCSRRWDTLLRLHVQPDRQHLHIVSVHRNRRDLHRPRGQPVEARIAVHGFDLMSNSNGALTLPLIGSGSLVDVTLEGAGVRVMLYGGQNGQSVQVPVIPEGDWTISSGQDVVLGPRPDGQPHQLNGDLTVANNAVLTLVSTEVVLSQGHTVTLPGTGQLIGEEATMVAAAVQARGQSVLTGTEAASLTLESSVQWGCLNARSVQHLNIVGALTVQPGCEIDITGGTVEGSVQAMTGAVFTVSSMLDLLVLDKGEPVEGPSFPSRGRSP